MRSLVPADLSAVMFLRLVTGDFFPANTAPLITSTSSQWLVPCPCQGFVLREVRAPAAFVTSPPAYYANFSTLHVQQDQRPPAPVACVAHQPERFLPDDPIRSTPTGRSLAGCGSYPPPNFRLRERPLRLHGFQTRSLEHMIHFHRLAGISGEKSRIQRDVADVSPGHVELSKTLEIQPLRRSILRKNTGPDGFPLRSIGKGEVDDEAQPALEGLIKRRFKICG